MSSLLARLGILIAFLCGAAFLPQPLLAESPEGATPYLQHVKPLLRERCYSCHGALRQQAELRLDTVASMLEADVVSAGKPAESRILERVSAADPDERMPPEGPPLAAEEIAHLRAWIEQGAAGPPDETPEADPREHWSFRPLVRPAIPAASASHPIDAFLAARHTELGLRPQAAVSKELLLRRVYLDLIGLPPTREELQAFLSDDSPDAYERVVDRLLNDPRHGERWARHWMDVWRYSDWYGRRHVPDVWNSAPQIWRWRDWIVESLNADRGYDRMVREMLAGDEISSDSEAPLATGYLIRNWYALNPNDWMRSNVEHTGKAFLGLTFNCAHCHDHKYDPISHDDYFSFRAFFEPIGIRQDQVAGEADPGPFQEYDYSVLRKIQRLGSVQIFDRHPESPTWFYTGGDERNRLTERGSIAPGVPAFLKQAYGDVEQIALPLESWYPGMRPELQAWLIAESQQRIDLAKQQVAAAQAEIEQSPAAVREEFAALEAAFHEQVAEAVRQGAPPALEGTQSLLFDAVTGRRALQNSLPGLTTIDDKTRIEFDVLLLSDAHFNFQLAKDFTAGLTAGLVAFDQGKIISYQPGGFNEFVVGNYDFAAGQKRFRVTVDLKPNVDRALLSVRCAPEDRLLVDNIEIAINGWNPTTQPRQGISFDARTGSVAVIDGLRVMSTDEEKPAIAFDFEPPRYREGDDISAAEGWSVSTFSAAPATSSVSQAAAHPPLREAAAKLAAARQQAHGPQLKLVAAEQSLAAATVELAAIEARIAAERAKHFGDSSADGPALAREASKLEREAKLKRSEADLADSRAAMAAALARPESDAMRAAEINAAMAKQTTALTAIGQAAAQLNDPALAENYSPLSRTYPTTSTGRRKALAEWITHADNPLTARVAVNHIWSRHFHAPLVATVYDFGRNGSPPAHPELLDYLAVELRESGWSMKHVHRLIVTSEAYRRSCSTTDRSSEVAADPDNRWLWRANVGRMESEVLRDSLLFLGGELRFEQGGQELENSESLTTTRRSLYYSVFPENGGKDPLGELFDAPDPAECYRRTRSVVPQQALALANSDLAHRTSQLVATQVAAECGDAEETFIAIAFERVLSRSATPEEKAASLRFLERQRQLASEQASGDPPREARESLVRALLNHNDFVGIR
jgi:hypothetical protein